MTTQAQDWSVHRYTLTGVDAAKFLQGQVTVDVQDLTVGEQQPTAICDLKGRVQFGLWISRVAEDAFTLTVSSDQHEALRAHIRKYGAFSKMTVSEPVQQYPAVVDGELAFADQPTDDNTWQALAIAQGQAWIVAATGGLFQPQELRLHQRGGVDYDKGCYLGQEIVARLYFRAKPKHWLHRVSGTGAAPLAGAQLADDVQVVNSIATASGFEALVVAKPAAIDAAGLTVLALPEALSGEVGRV